MDPFESNAHSFIVKIWLEESEDESERPLWRGHITHVPSRNRVYFDDLDAVAEFIAGYLQEMGMTSEDMWKSVQGWIRRHGF